MESKKRNVVAIIDDDESCSNKTINTPAAEESFEGPAEEGIDDILKRQKEQAAKWSRQIDSFPELTHNSFIFLEMKRKADEGDVDAQLTIANHYYDEDDGLNGFQDLSYHYYTLASEQGHPTGFYGLSLIMSSSPMENELLAFETMMKAANMGLPDAQFRVGVFYLGSQNNANYPQRDTKLAFYWVEKSAFNDFEAAQFLLARMYEVGVGVEVSNVKAFDWFYKAALAGLAQAQYTVGQYFEKGLIGEANIKEAYTWKLKAAKQGMIEVNNVLMVENNGYISEAATYQWISTYEDNI